MSKEKKFTQYEIAQMEAINGILNQSDVSFFRKVCRWYSKSFSTPLHLVMKGEIISWDDVLIHYYEDRMEEVDYNQVFEIAVTQYIPELADEIEEDNEQFAKDLVEEQKRTIERKRKRDKAKQPKVEVEEKEFKPISIAYEDEEGIE